MPYCPDCRDEFEDWVEVCPDCGVNLVDAMPEPPDAPEPSKPPKAPKAPRSYSNEPLVHVATAPNEAIAAFWAGILEDNGIQCLCKSPEFRAACYVILSHQHVSIHVLKSSALRARRLLAPMEKDLKEYVDERGNCWPLAMRIAFVIVCLFS